MKGRKFAFFFILLFVLIIVVLAIIGEQKQSDIMKNGKEIIVQFIKKKNYPKTTDYYFTYYVGNDKRKTSNSGIGYDLFDSDSTINAIDSLKIRRFYIAKFLSKYPDAIIVNPYRQVTDTAAILKAGFSAHDLTLPVIYSHD